MNYQHEVKQNENCVAQSFLDKETCAEITYNTISFEAGRKTGRRLGERFREHLRSTRQTNTDLAVGRHFASPRHASTDMLVSVIRSGFRDTRDRRRFEGRMITKRYIREDLIPTLPSYNLPKSMRASNIEIVFDLNVHTRAHFGQRAQITSN